MSRRSKKSSSTNQQRTESPTVTTAAIVWKWTKRLSPLVFTAFGWILNYYIQWESRKALQRPDVVIDYSATDFLKPPKVSIRNEGDEAADSIWLSQRYYMVAPNKEIFFCDLPAYSYVTFNGSKRSMFCLEENHDTTITVDQPCLWSWIVRISKQFNGQLVCVWQADFYRHGSTHRESTKSYYHMYDNSPNNPIPVEEVTGGQGIAQTIEDYERHSVPKEIVFVSEFKKFYINPPSEYVKDSQGNPHFVLPGLVSIGQQTYVIDRPVAYNITSSSYVAFKWSCDASDSTHLGKQVFIDEKPIY